MDYPPGESFGAYATAQPVSAGVVYYESHDGYSWEEKGCSPIELGGQTGADGTTFLIDPHGPPSERYKLVYFALAPKREWPKLFEQYRRLKPHERDWRGQTDIGTEDGQPITLHFHLRAAEIFGFTWA